MSNLFARKSIHQLIKEADDSEKGLKKTLGPLSLIALGIGVIIGAGLFSITGSAAANNAGPAVTISFIIAGLGCAFAGLCYAEFSSMIPIAGSAYTYSYATMGEFIAWIIGWDLVLEYAVGSATVAISWSRYLVKFFSNLGIDLPMQLVMSPFDSATLADGSIVSGIVNLPAVFIVLIVSVILARGIKESAAFTTFIVSLKLVVVFAFIILGWKYMNPENHVPYIIKNEGVFGEYGWSGIIRAAAIVFGREGHPGLRAHPDLGDPG
ncbi:MAG TPA: amino acid permease, partial [Chitinophagales bacterium]|nr:amino acid permease [Chitinophagales bacterium]